MLYGKSASEAAQERRVVEVNSRDYQLSGYVGVSPVRGYYLEGNEVNDNGEPQGFLVEQPPGAVTLPHFHETNQFQVVVGGSGRFGKKPTRPVSVQYANAHTPYGPIVSGEAGITYFTLRANWDPGAKYMPASRDRLVKGNQRSRLVAGVAQATARERGRRTATEIDTLMEPEPDGLAAWMARLAPGGTAPPADPSGSGGQYLVVTGGELICDGRSLPRLSVLFITHDEPPLSITAGAGGLELLILQFPRA